MFQCIKILTLRFLKNVKLLGEIDSNWPNDLLGINVYKTLESCWQSFLTILQWTNTTSVIFNEAYFHYFFSLVVLFLVLPSNIIVSGVNISR